MNYQTIEHLKDQFRLPEKLNEEIYREEIIPSILKNFIFSYSERNNPSVHYLAAQPGSGKTSLRNKLKNNSTIVINTDDLREFHPSYSELLEDPLLAEKAPLIVNPDSTIWLKKLQQEAIKIKADIILDSTFGTSNIDGYITIMEDLKKIGYQLHLHALAVKLEISKLGNYQRYEETRNMGGYARFVEISTQDQNFKNLLPNIIKVSQSGLLDSVSSYGRTIIKDSPEGPANFIDVRQMQTIKGNENIKQHIGLISSSMNNEYIRPLTNNEKLFYADQFKRVLNLIKLRDGDVKKFLKNNQGIKRLAITEINKTYNNQLKI